MAAGPADDLVQPEWAPLALRALLEGTTVHVGSDGTWVTVRTTSKRRTVVAGQHGRPDATVVAPFPIVLGAAAGVVEVDPGLFEVSGSIDVAAAALSGARPGG